MNYIPQCEWHPASHPYAGSAAAAIMAMPMPLDVRQRLVLRERDGYDFVASVDRDSVRAPGASFQPEVSYMNFGDGRTVCVDVSRKTWAPEQVETAMVYCDSSGWCIAKFSVCGNWAILARKPEEPGPVAWVPFAPEGWDVPDYTVGAPLLPASPAGPLPLEASPSYPPFGGGGAPVFFGGGSFSGGSWCPPCPCDVSVPPVVIPAVPEGSTWAYIVAGLMIVLMLVSPRRRKLDASYFSMDNFFAWAQKLNPTITRPQADAIYLKFMAEKRLADRRGTVQ